MWTLDSKAEPPRWRLADPSPQHLASFSTRRGGVSVAPFDSMNLGRSSGDDLAAVEANRARLLAALGLSPAHLATAGQVHGAGVRIVEAPGHHPECDALVTTRTDLVIAVSAADCLPILFLAPGGAAAAHAGWRGLVAGVAAATLVELARVAATGVPAVTIHFGPCIRSCCFQVGSEVARQFPADVVESRAGSLYVDLPAAARRSLLNAGAVSEAISDIGACTACEPHWYYSYRRDHGRTGRLWGVAGVRSRSA